MVEQFIKKKLQVRNDPAGAGHFGAPRGSRAHKGVDYVCIPGELVAAPVSGSITRYGYCYGDDLQWRYVQITDKWGNDHRIFYCTLTHDHATFIAKGEPIGPAQDIRTRYQNEPHMLPHIHYEIRNQVGDFVNPEEFDYEH